MYFLYRKGNLIRIKTGLDTYLIRIRTRTPLSRYPPYDYSSFDLFSRVAKRGGFKRGGFPIWTCPSFFVLFGTFPMIPGFAENPPGLLHGKSSPGKANCKKHQNWHFQYFPFFFHNTICQKGVCAIPWSPYLLCKSTDVRTAVFQQEWNFWGSVAHRSYLSSRPKKIRNESFRFSRVGKVVAIQMFVIDSKL